MPRADRRRSARASPSRSRRRLLVVSAGSTELAYVAGLRHHRGARSVDVTTKQRVLDPVGLVEYSTRLAREAANYDEVWCVVDVDEFDIAAAETAAAARGVALAVSDPCLELWLLLHFEDCRGYLAGYADAARRLRRHLPGYDKARLDFADFADGLPAAVKRARELVPGRNPSTGMWRLVERVTE